MKNILVISDHTDLGNNSFANKIILNELQELVPEAEYLFLDKENIQITKLMSKSQS